VWRRVRESLYALPSSFHSATVISGIRATEIFTLNAALAATIEDQVVTTLNSMRGSWDPGGAYKPYRFVRQAQKFPDVLLKRRKSDGTDDILFGIELKGWYLLAKEKEPSLRFQTDPDACAVPDLIAVVPWALSNVISGTPMVFDPWTESARYSAEFRNYHWSEVRRVRGGRSREVRRPANPRPYPDKADQVADAGVDDQGSNFGRIARIGLMDTFLDAALSQEVVGVPAQVWIDFFKTVERLQPTPLMVPTGVVEQE